jgi:ABC-2 type transport system ATP-binding protein
MTGQPTAMVEAQGLAKHYGSLGALEDLTFAVEAGEILGVLGPNGAGKTTAIRILTTIVEPTRGTFSIARVPQTEAAEIRRRIGVLPESAGYPERQTGEEFLRYHARLFGHSRASSRTIAATLLADVGLSDRAGSLIGTYSRGMRQRLGIARALVNSPQVVILDEPTLGLDPAGQRQVLGMIQRVARERGATVLMSTHLLAEVEETCTRVLILNRGRVVAQGTVAEVTRQAAAPRTATVRVAPDDAARTAEILTGSPGIESVSALEGRPGALAITVDGAEANGPLRALLAEAVPVLAYELEPSRLSDAFLAVTGAAP